jgi:Dolichyl-phosphate-mannose-protein mannosyltransferase
VDTTVVETDIHHTTDSALLGDGVRVLTRSMQRIAKLAGRAGTKLRDPLTQKSSPGLMPPLESGATSVMLGADRRATTLKRSFLGRKVARDTEARLPMLLSQGRSPPGARTFWSWDSGAATAALLLGALVVNVSIAVLTRRHVVPNLLDADEREYWDLAVQLLQHGGLSAIPARRTLPFPLLLSTLQMLFNGDYFRVQIALSVLLAATPLLIFQVVSKHLGDRRIGVISALLAMCWPLFVRYGATIYSDSFALLLFLMFLWALPHRIVHPSGNKWRRKSQWFVSGVLLSLVIQLKPMYLLYVPFAILLCVLHENTGGRRLGASVLLVLGCGLTLLPWAAYISSREGHTIVVSANGGETLAGGLNPRLLQLRDDTNLTTAEGRVTSVGPGKWLAPDDTGFLTTQELQLPYSEMSRRLSLRARAWILSHPADVLYISARKLLYMWGIYPFWSGAFQTTFGNIPILLLVAAAALGLWQNRRSSVDLAMFWTLPVFVSCVALVSWGSWRFRMPGDFGSIVLASTIPFSRVPGLLRAPHGGRGGAWERPSSRGAEANGGCSRPAPASGGRGAIGRLARSGTRAR